MEILIVCDVLGEENNGTTIAAMNLIRYLKGKGDTVRVLCADQDKIGQENTYVVPNKYLGKIINHMLEKNNVNLAQPVKEIIDKAMEGVDLVHIMLPFALGIAAAREAKIKGIPVTAGFHCQAENVTSHIFNTMKSKTVNDLIYKNFYNKLYKYVNAIHYPTEFIRKVFETTIKRKTNGYVISNGVNDRYIKKEIERSLELSKTFNILFIGRLSKEKCHDVLIKAVSESKYKDNIQLIFAGQGPKEMKCYELADKYNIKTPIIKFFSRDDLVNIINSCDLYVHPSTIEIEAISCLEAIKCGLVPVISDSKKSATNAFALTSNNLFKDGDSKDLANKIDYWIEHIDERKECSNNYLGYTNQFNQDNCMEKMRNMLLTYSKKENHTTKQVYYYRDEKNDDFANNGISQIKTPANFKYIHTNCFYRFFEFILYRIIAKPLVKLMNKIFYRQTIVNNLTKPLKLIPGCFMYANHTSGMADAYTPNIIFNRRNNIIVNPDAISIPGIKTIVSMLGALPLPSTLEGTKNFLDAIEQKTKKGEIITIYPEAHIWPYYTKIRNFSSASFRYPVNLNKPVICITNTYVPYKKTFKLITYLDGPYYPDPELNHNDAISELRDIVYATMVKRSNEIKQYKNVEYINLKDIEVN